MFAIGGREERIDDESVNRRFWLVCWWVNHPGDVIVI